MIELSGVSAAVIMENLIRWRLSDESGMSADRLSLTINADDMKSPPLKGGDEIKVILGGEKRGAFKASTVSLSLKPVREWVIQLSPATFQRADPQGWREKRKRTFPPATVGDVVKSVMVKHGYTVRVEPALAALPTDHLNQNEETDKAFISRLAEEFDAIAKPINGLFVFGTKGSLQSLSGETKKPVTITLADLKTGNVDFPTDDNFKGVKASWRESATGRNGETVIGGAPFSRMKQTFANEAEAERKAEAELKKISRHGQVFTGSLKGRAGFFAESVLTFDEPDETLLLGAWSLDKVTHSGTRTAHTIQFTATRPKG